MKSFPVIPGHILESICRIAGHTETGLTGTEIGKYLRDNSMNDVSPTMSKWKRLYNACAEFQNRKGISNNILKFIQTAFHPSRFINNNDQFEYVRSELNTVMSFIGLEYGEDGVFRPVSKSRTISEAERRASGLLLKLTDRGVHDDVLRFCKAELLEENYFHAVFETTKSVADKIRSLAALTSDGSRLIDEAFGLNNPILLINPMQNETEKSEHTGFMNLLKGFFGMFRNTTAHVPKIKWVIDETDALDIMSMASLCHRRLDKAIRVNQQPIT